MDHIYDEFKDISPFGSDNGDLEDEILSEQDEMMAKLLSASDYLCRGDMDNALEVIEDIKEKTSDSELE